MIKGSCLCGGIQFEFTGAHSDIGVCHCSLCRKVSGVGATASVAIGFAQLRWISGQQLVTSFERPSGYGATFCRVCGSPAPETDDRRTMYTIPVGLIDGDPPLHVADHIHVASKAGWDRIGDDAPQFATDGPDRPRVRIA
jgi:hypothetical protein